MIVERKTKIEVMILGSNEKGILEGSQNDFFGNTWYFVRSKKILLPYKKEQLRYIEKRKKA